MISVIVPIYKVEKYLTKCIDSIINQRYKDLEIILVDDGSPDNCPEICDKYAEQDNRIKVIHKENGRLLAARKSGVEASTGEYVTFVDGDDHISRFMYEEVAKAIDKYSPDMVITEFLWSYEKKDIPSERTLFKDFYSREEIENEIIPSMFFTGTYYQFGIYPNCWTKIVKRDNLINNIMDVDERVRMGEDAAFTYGCIMDSQSVAVVKRPLYYYRVIDTSMSKAYDANLPSTWNIAYESISNKADSLGIDIKSQLNYYLLYMMNILIRNEASKSNNKASADNKAAINTFFDENYLEALNSLDTSPLPVHTRVFHFAITHKSRVAVNIYKLLLRKFLL